MGTNSLEIPVESGQTARDVLNVVVERYPQLENVILNPDGSLTGHVAVILNGRNILHLDGLATPVSNDDRFDLFPPVGGGAGQDGHTRVTIKFTSHCRERLGIIKTKFAFKGNTLKQFVPAVLQEFDVADLVMRDGKFKPNLRVVINGR